MTPLTLSPGRARLRALAASLIVPLLSLFTPATAGAAVTQQIQGDGSTWAQNAVTQWIADTQQQEGLQVVFTGTGSAQGRQDFANGTVDFAVSDIGYQGHDPVTGSVDSSSRPYVYVPIVAGGTAFPYHVVEAGQLVRNIRLSGLTIAKIFTNQITNWNDPAITADNNGRQLPSLPIIPVVHSEGAGSTAQFTTWLAQQYPSVWKSFAGYSSFTEYYPRQGQQVAQNGSDGVMNFLTSAAANGAIGYDEYSYALAKNYPAIKVQNAAGYYTLPTQYNVAVALTQAQINTDKSSPDYLLQNLTNVYTYNDPRTYPLSSYSYGIIPTSGSDTRMNTAKRQTLADYLGYSTCQGQAEIGPIGYSPLPVNLVQASFDQVQTLHTADPNVDVTHETVQQCHNPTFDPNNPNSNYLATIAPQPPACDKSGAGPCDSTAGTANSNPVAGKAPTATGTSAAGGSTTATGAKATGGGASAAAGGGGSSAVGSTSGGVTSGSAATSAGATPVTSIDPQTGAVVTVGGSTAGSSSGSDLPAAADVLTPTLLAASSGGGVSHGLLTALIVVALLALIALPPLTVRTLRRRGGA